MEGLHLIAHKVRGEMAIDVAEKMEVGEEELWIIPTSGHRAYPYEWIPLTVLAHDFSSAAGPAFGFGIPPHDLRDHYEAEPAPKGKGRSIAGLLEKLGLVKPLKPAQSFKRRDW